MEEEWPVDRKKLLPILCAVCGILAGIGGICAAVMDQSFPKPLWLLISLGYLLGVIGCLLNYRNLNHKDNK